MGGKREAALGGSEIPALIARFDMMRDSGICSPTTRSLLDDAQAAFAQAWDEGYRAGSLDGYFERREETNPYRHNGFDHCPGCQAAHQAKEAQK